jgi:hypothetical protein
MPVPFVVGIACCSGNVGSRPVNGSNGHFGGDEKNYLSIFIQAWWDVRAGSEWTVPVAYAVNFISAKVFPNSKIEYASM